MVTIILTVVSGRGAARRRVRAAQDLSRGVNRAGAAIQRVNAGKRATQGQPVPARARDSGRLCSYVRV
jgi:hypothetical protein